MQTPSCLESAAEWLAERRAAAADRRGAERSDLPASLARARTVALITIAVLSTAGTVAALAESYRNLLEWALHHHVFTGFAWAWPLTVDSFVLIPEVVLFVAMVDHWHGWAKVWPWLVIAGGLSASVAGNIGSLGTSPTWPDRLTAAASPGAAFVALTLALAVLKRVIIQVRAAVVAVDDIPATTRDIVTRLESAGIRDTGQLASIAGVTARQIQRIRKGSESATEPSAADAATPDRPGRRRVSEPRLRTLEGVSS